MNAFSVVQKSLSHLRGKKTWALKVDTGMPVNTDTKAATLRFSWSNAS